jgi:hypothetical protein
VTRLPDHARAVATRYDKRGYVYLGTAAAAAVVGSNVAAGASHTIRINDPGPAKYGTRGFLNP